MSRTVRVNVLSEKYVPKGSESLFIRNIATTLMKNLESSWKEKLISGRTMRLTMYIQLLINVTKNEQRE